MTPTNDAPVTVEPADELVEMLQVGTETGAFDHTPEEIGLHVMENAQAILNRLAALASAPAGDGKTIDALYGSIRGLRSVLQDIANDEGDTVLGRRCIAAISKSRVAALARPRAAVGEQVETAAASLDALSDWLLANDHDMKLPDAVAVDPRDVADLLRRREHGNANLRTLVDRITANLEAHRADNRRLRAALDEQSREAYDALVRARDLAMRMTVDARIPECGHFGAIAQDLDAILALQSPPAKVEGRREALSRMVAIDEELGLYDE